MGIVLSQNVTVDGVMQSPGPTDVPFKYRGWAVNFGQRPGNDRFDYESEVGLDETSRAQVLLLGRTTYEAMRASWPNAEGDLADRINRMPKYVVSSTLTERSWNTTVLGSAWPDQVAQMRDELPGDLLVYGSRRLSQALIGMGLVDELRLIVYPLAFGTGDRLFTDMSDILSLRLIESRSRGGGVVTLVYAPAPAEN